MRKRVLVPLLLFGLVAVLAVLIPAMLTISQSRTQAVQISRKAVVDHVVQLVQRTRYPGTSDVVNNYLRRHTQLYRESMAIIDPDGSVQVAVGGTDLTAPATLEAIAAAAKNLPRWEFAAITPFSPKSVSVAQPIPGDGELSTGVVLLEINLETARKDVLNSWLGVLILGLLALTGLAVLALRWTNSVLRPVHAIEEAAIVFPAYRDLSHISATGPREIRTLSVAFERMASGVEATLNKQREFVADASHQLRNPLAAIRLRIDSQSRTYENENESHIAGPAETNLVDIDRDLDRLEQIVDRMLILAGIEHRVIARQSGMATASHPLPPVPKWVSAESLVSRQRGLHEQVGQKLIASEVDVLIRSDISDLEELIGILLENARNYAGANATVWVELVSVGDAAVVTVDDDGPGISPEDIESAVTRFWRGKNTGSGTGLGLAIANELAKANDGRLQLQKSPRGGLRVRIEFS